MASIDKHPKSPFYRVIYRDAEGRRVCKSLKTKDRSVAMKMAAEIENAVKQARASTLTIDRARAIVNGMLEATGQSPLDSESTRQFFQRWLAGKVRTKAANTGIRYASVVSEFLKSLGKIADKPLAALTAKHIEGFRDKKVDEGRSATTLRLDIKIVAFCLGQAMRQGLIATNPAQAVELDEAQSASREAFSAQEIESLMAASTGDWRTAIMLAAFAGLRLGDAAGLTWEAIDLAEGELSFTPQKTKRKGRKLTIPLHPRLQEHLETIAGDDPRAPLTPSLKGKPTGGSKGLSRQFVNLMESAGIDRASHKSNATQARAVSAKTFHSLRHSFNSALMNSGVEEKVRMQLSGHSTASVNRKYSHPEKATLKAAIQKIGASK